MPTFATEGQREIFPRKSHCTSLGWIMDWKRRRGERGSVEEGGGGPSYGCQAFQYIPARGPFHLSDLVRQCLAFHRTMKTLLSPLFHCFRSLTNQPQKILGMKPFSGSSFVPLLTAHHRFLNLLTIQKNLERRTEGT